MINVSLQKTLFNTYVRQNSESKKKHSHKTISVSIGLYHQLEDLKDLLQQQRAGYVSFNSAIHELLQIQSKFSELKQKYTQVKQQNTQMVKEENQFLKQLLLQQTQQNRFSNTMNSTNPTGSSPQNFMPPPPPSKSCKPKKPMKPYTPPNTGDLKRDFVQEIKQVFTGDFLKPSDILHTTKPKHSASEVHTISENFQVPSIESISVAKRYTAEQEAIA